VKVGIEFQVSAEGMWNDYEPHADTVSNFYPEGYLLDSGDHNG
jgi:hypothetical protein